MIWEHFFLNEGAKLTSSKCLLLSSNTPFCCGVSTQDGWWMIPSFRRFEKVTRSDWNNPCIVRSDIGKTLVTYDFCFKRKIQITLVQSSMNETNHFTLEILGTLYGPQICEWTNANGVDDHVLFKKMKLDVLQTCKHHNLLTININIFKQPREPCFEVN